ncbi:MAG: hypothetical protein GEV09_17645 [Pseudonocardiaceae bacterium]|nr:hypothetical protein [Pseudonocardiaceae bacterium]
MIDWLATVVIAAALVMAGWTVLLALRHRRPGWMTLGGVAVAELAAVVQLVVAVVLLVVGQRPDALAAFLGYHVVALLVLPAAVAWSLAERSRWSPGVIAVGCLALAVMTVRMQQIWQTAGG